MRAFYISEPSLKFGKGTHIDIRTGLQLFGPADANDRERPAQISVGVVGLAPDVEKFRNWFTGLVDGVDARDSRYPSYFTEFPGIHRDHTFFTEVVWSDHGTRSLSSLEEKACVEAGSFAEFADGYATIVARELTYIKEKAKGVRAVFVVPSREVEARRFGIKGNYRDEGERASLWGKLKASAMAAGLPTQIIWPKSYDGPPKGKSIPTFMKMTQDAATVAWNLVVALYYKAGGTPWKLPTESTEGQNCYLGISFFKANDPSAAEASVAQVFGERGEGVVARGGNAVRTGRFRELHLSREDTRDLITKAMRTFISEHEQTPRFLVVHKTTQFDTQEVLGAEEACNALNVRRLELISFSRGPDDVRLFRDGPNAPLRGTVMEVDTNEMFIATRGVVPGYGFYPGDRVPRALHVRCTMRERSNEDIASEILALTKMNWNKAHYDGAEPMTIYGARKVGDVIKYAGGDLEPRYSFYM